MFKLPPTLSKQLKGLLEMAIDKLSQEEAGDTDPATEPKAESETTESQPDQPGGLPPDRPAGTKDYLARRWRWLKRYPWVAGLAILAIIVVFVVEHNWGEEPWVAWRQAISEQWQNSSSNYRVTLLFTTLTLLVFLTAGFLVRMGLWIRSHWGRSIFFGIVLLSLGFTIYSNLNTWGVTAVVVTSDGISDQVLPKEAIATQFQGNLNAIGVAPFDTVALSLPNQSPVVDELKNTLDLSFDVETRCQQILRGPRSFDTSTESIILPRSSEARSSDNLTGGEGFSFTTAVGTFNFPLENIIRSVVRWFPGYREVNVQVILANRANPAEEAGVIEDETIHVIVNDSGGQSWTVSGPRRDIPQLMNYLVHRIVLDLQREADESFRPPVNSADLALTLGNQAFSLQDFTGALAYYRLAQSLRSNDANTQMMLGLTLYQLSTTSPVSDTLTQEYQFEASQAFDRALALELFNTSLRAYQICFDYILSNKDSLTLEARNSLDLTKRGEILDISFEEEGGRVFDPAGQLATLERINELSKKPALGPGRHFSKFRHNGTAEPRYDLYFFWDDTIYYLRRQEVNKDIPPQFETFNRWTAKEAIRQIFAAKHGVYFVTASGEVKFFQPDRGQAISVIDAPGLIFESGGSTIYSGGILQIFVESTAEFDLIFLLDRYGGIQRIRITGTDRGELERSGQTYAQHQARQVFLADHALYYLKKDGTVWRIPNPREGDLQTSRQLIADRNNREITVDNGVIYTLQSNGNIWRYVDVVGVADRYRLIDAGHQTRRILSARQGLLVLKNDGSVFLIRNPLDPKKDDTKKLKVSDNDERLALTVLDSHLITLDLDRAGFTVKPHEAPLPDPTVTPQLLDTPSPTPEPTVTPLPTPTPSIPATLIPVPPTLPPTATLPPTETPRPEPTQEPPPPTETQVLVANPTSTPESLPPPTLEPSPEPATPEPTREPAPDPTEEPASEPTREASPVLAEALVPVLIKNSSDEENWFWISPFEVTNREYRECINDGLCPLNNRSYDELFLQENFPVVGVDWHQARIFCEQAQAQGQAGRLPTVSEWYAAVSPDGRIYPWGNTLPTCEEAVVRDCPTKRSLPEPVGSRPAGALNGVFDLIGNVWEWTATQGAGRDDVRVILGGSFSNPDGTIQGGYENFVPPNPPVQGESHQSNNLGFRCVWDYSPPAE